MEELKKWLIDNLPNKLGWRILHKIKDANIDLGDWEIVMTDNEVSDRNIPFTFSPGYLSLKNNEDKISIKELIALIKQLVDYFPEDKIVHYNLFVFMNRVSCRREDYLPGGFLSMLNKKQTRLLMEIYIEEINALYSNLALRVSQPKSTDEWLDCFTSTQYQSSFSDPIEGFNSISKKITGKWESELNDLMKLNPYPRARAVDFYGITLKATSKQIIDVINKGVSEASFIAAYIIDYSPREEVFPHWLTEDIIHAIYLKYWKTSGGNLLQYAFGLYLRGINEKMQEQIKVWSDSFLKNQLIENTETCEILNSDNLEWPRDFISLTNWMNEKSIELSKIHQIHRFAIGDSFTTKFEKIVKSAPENIRSDNHNDEIKFYLLNNEKYLLSFAHLLLFVNENENLSKRFKNIFFDIRQLYYGSWEAQHLAEKLTEFAFIFLLSLVQINLNGAILTNIKNIIDYFTDILSYSYILRAEQTEYIWNPEYAFNPGSYEYPKFIINEWYHGLSLKIEYKDYFDKINETFNNYKTAQWPFERLALKEV